MRPKGRIWVHVVGATALTATLTLLLVAVPGVWGLCRWRVASCGARWGTVILLALCAVMIAYRFAKPGPPLAHTQLLGLRTYARAKADIPAIQAWLATLDPNDCQGQDVGMQHEPVQPHGPKSIPRPPCLARFGYVRLTKDDAGRPMVQITLGGGGLLGCWGVTVGDPNMGTEVPRQGSLEETMSLAPAAYVWVAG